MDTLASATPGFSGADLYAMLNSAALMAATRGADKVELKDIEEARDKIIMGVCAPPGPPLCPWGCGVVTTWVCLGLGLCVWACVCLVPHPPCVCRACSHQQEAAG